jgi:demethylmenaquinone methyltransferase/2-methoxy-6-polyprenyl-1,4-benzoquinol methylase
MTQDDIYDPLFVGRLFDEMSRTYGVVNMISSLGFARRWRRQCLRSISIPRSAVILDLMTGTGELCPDLLSLLGPAGRIQALDISAEMCGRARTHVSPDESPRLHILQADALCCPVEDESVDCIVSTFGLKTFNSRQLARLATEVCRVLRPGGQFAFLEISVPRSGLLRLPYMAYLHYVIPLIGRLALGNPDNYRLLGIYTSTFGDCRKTADCFASAGLAVEYRAYFFGCATGVTGVKSN